LEEVALSISHLLNHLTQRRHNEFVGGHQHGLPGSAELDKDDLAAK
jgi:hypothetical protein